MDVKETHTLRKLPVSGILTCILTWSVWFWTLDHHYTVVWYLLYDACVRAK